VHEKALKRLEINIVTDSEDEDLSEYDQDSSSNNGTETRNSIGYNSALKHHDGGTSELQSALKRRHTRANIGKDGSVRFKKEFKEVDYATGNVTAAKSMHYGAM
jgi:hypothetical protein